MTLSFVLCTSLRYIRSTSIILITNQFCNLASLPVIPFDVSRWVCPLVLWVVFYSSHILISTAIIPRARESSVTHKSAITDHAVEENHVIDWDKAKMVDREAQRQTRWIREALWIRKTPTCMNRDAGSYQLSCTWEQVISRSQTPLSCKQSRCDQEMLSLGNIFQLCRARSFYIIVRTN